MKRTLLWWAAMAALHAHAEDPRPLTTVELKERAARPVIIVAPTYPRDALAGKIEGTVDVFGTVQPDGVLQVGRMEASPDREDFKAAVRDVIEYWRVMPEYGGDCRPHPTAGEVRVWFELKGDRPVISVSRAPPPPREPDPGKHPTLKVRRRVDPEYPRAAIFARVEATLEAYILVEPDGKVSHVEVAPTPSPRQFGTAVRTALAGWEFEPRPGEAALCAYYEVRFRMRG